MFLSAKKYTHMVIAPDDLIVTTKDFDILMNDVKEFDYPTIAGTCNLQYGDPRPITGRQLVNPWLMPVVLYSMEELEYGDPIKKVGFDGFAFTFIRRDVVKQIEFHSRRYMSSAFDNAFAQECHEHDIPLRVDCRAKMLHLANRLGTGGHENWGNGKKPYLKFERYS